MATKVKLIETGAVTGNIIPDGGIATGKLADDAVTTIKITDANITHAKLHTSMDLTGKTVTVATAAGSTNTTAAASTAFVQQELTTLIGGAPSTLNDLNELAAAINDDANYNSTLTTALATKLPLAGGTMTGNIVMGDNNITGINKLEIFDSADNNRLEIYGNASNGFIFDMGGTGSTGTINFNDFNVGIGVVPESGWASTATALQFGESGALWGDTSGEDWSYFSSNTYWDGTNFKYKNTNQASYYVQDNQGEHVWAVAPSGTADANITFNQAMRLDQSGKLLLGTTNIAPGSGDVAGSVISPDGYISVSRTSVSAEFNRIGTNGDIIVFRKGGTLVGSWQARGDVVSTIILDPRTNGAGLTATSNTIYPTSNTGAIGNTTALVDLGTNGYEFRNLSLSGLVTATALNLSASSPTLTLETSANSNNPLITLKSNSAITNEGAQIYYNNNAGTLHITTTYANAAADIKFHTATGTDIATNNVRMTIAGDGNVGIGTTSPSTPLHVTHVGNPNGGNRNTVEDVLTLEATGYYPYAGYGIGINFQGEDYGNTAIRDYGKIQAVMDGNLSQTAAGDAAFSAALAFRTNSGGASSTVSTEKMRITGNGDLVLGAWAENPAGFSGWRAMNIRGLSTGGMLNFENSSGTRSFTFANQGVGMRYQGHIAGSYHRFETNGEANALYITDAGDVGIGTSDASDTAWGPIGLSKALTIDGTSGFANIHLRGTGSGSAPGRFSMGVGNEKFYMAYDDIAGTHRIIVEPTGNVTLSNNLAFGNGGGVDFSATPNSGTTGATHTSSLLDDYEEGYWTPIFTGSSGGTFTMSLGLGSYTKIGNLIHLTWYAGTSGLGTATGQIRIGNLPYAALGGGTSNSRITTGSCMVDNLTLNSGRTMVVPYMSHAGSDIKFYQSGTSVGWIETPVDAVFSMIGGISYRTV